MNRLQAAEHMRRALQMFASTLTDEAALQVPFVYDAWQTGKSYSAGDMLRWGENAVGNPQLYRVVMAHTAQADWTPEAIPALYTPIGLDAGGYPLWSRPAGAHDAYMAGDVVDYEGTLYVSIIDGNVYAPDEYPAGWELYTEATGDA